LPNEKIDKETDKNPDSDYEDTNSHERVGLRADDTKKIQKPIKGGQ
jgi:hypothetical protein